MGITYQSYMYKVKYSKGYLSYNFKYKYVTRKMVPITGRASASFSSMLKLERIGN